MLTVGAHKPQRRQFGKQTGIKPQNFATRNNAAARRQKKLTAAICERRATQFFFVARCLRWSTSLEVTRVVCALLLSTTAGRTPKTMLRRGRTLNAQCRLARARREQA